MNALIAPDQVRQDFFAHERLVTTLYRAVKPDPVAIQFVGRVACLSAIGDALRAKLHPNPADISVIMGGIAYNSKNIYIPNHGFAPGLAVLYASPTVQLHWLIGGTTYFVSYIDGDNIRLADTAAHAVAGTNQVTFLTSMSSQTATTATLTPLAYAAGSVAAKWQVSNDGTNWVDLSGKSTDFDSGAFSTPSHVWDFGAVNYRYLRMNFVAPTSGQVRMDAVINIP
mgnify:CR=1 FL=1